MFYYHYSTEGFPELKSLVAQGRKGRNSDVERSTLTIKRTGEVTFQVALT